MRNMKQRIRNRGLTPKEIFLQRDLTSNKPKDVDDNELSEMQASLIERDHPINE